MRVTHLNLTETTRQLAGMRSAQLRISMAEYVSRLVRADSDLAGLSDFLAEGDAEPSAQATAVLPPTDDNERSVS
jgi:hypothetical protein